MIASPTRRPLHVALAPALLVGVLALSACGGSDESTTTNAGATGGSGYGTTNDQRSGGRGNMDELRACLKKQGVELPERPANQNGEVPSGQSDARPEGAPDGGPGGEGGLPGGPPGGPPAGRNGQGRQGGPFGDLSDEEREKLQKAMEECGGQVPNGNGRGGPGGQRQRPDVDSAAYRTSIDAYVTCVRKNGYDLPDPDFSGDGPIFDPKEVDQTDVKFQKASKACQSTLRSSGGGRSGDGNGGSGSKTTTTQSSGA